MNKILALCLAAAGAAVLPAASVSAHEAPAPVVTISTAPSIVRINETVVTTRTVHRHRRYRTVRRRVRRNGHYVTVTRRVYY